MTAKTKKPHQSRCSLSIYPAPRSGASFNKILLRTAPPMPELTILVLRTLGDQMKYRGNAPPPQKIAVSEDGSLPVKDGKIIGLIYIALTGR